MGYVEQNLGKDEKILARVQHTWAGLVGSLAVNFIVSFLVILLVYGITTWLPTLLITMSDASIGSISSIAMSNASTGSVSLIAMSDASIESISEMQQVYDILMIFRNVIVAIVIIIACYRVIRTGVSIHCNQLIVTNKRLFGKRGFISRNIIDIVLLKLDTINSKNGLLGAIFHYGTLEVVSAGSQKVVGGQTVNMTFPYVKNTEEFRRAVLAAIDTAREAERQAQAEAQVSALKRAQELNER